MSVMQITEQGPDRVRIKMLQQMAEALDDEAEALYRRAASFEDEDYLLTREIEERVTEINRMKLRLDAVRRERRSVIRRIEERRVEAAAIREEIFEGEDELVIQNLGTGELDRLALNAQTPYENHDDSFFADLDDEPDINASFFRKVTLKDRVA